MAKKSVALVSLFLGISWAATMPPAMPDKTLTPGVANPKVTKEMICKPGYTAGKDVRHVTQATKKEVFRRYKIPWSEHAKYEVDHFISLELGGANEIANLWPQYFCPKRNTPAVSGCLGAREKDVSETGLHRQVCQGKITLQDAQRIITTDWISCYKAIKKRQTCH